MPEIKLNLEGDNAWTDLREMILDPSSTKLRNLFDISVISMVLLPRGTKCGNHTVGIRIDEEDGTTTILQTTFACLENAVHAMRAKIEYEKTRGNPN